MVHVAPWQVRRQCLPFGRLLAGGLVAGSIAVDAQPLDLSTELGQVLLQRVLQQALLLGAAGELLARSGELHALEHRHFVRELVDERLLERHVALAPLDQRVLGAQLFVARGHLGHQRQHGLPHLRIQGL